MKVNIMYVEDTQVEWHNENCAVGDH